MMKFIFFSSVWLPLWLASFSVQAATDSWCKDRETLVLTTLGEQQLYDRSCALIITASTYERHGSGWPDIPNEKEGDDLHVALKRQGFDSRRINHVMAGQLLKEMQDFCAKNGTKDARLLMYFAGHGWTPPGGVIGYIVPEDGADYEKEEKKFRQQSVSTDEILKLSHTCRAKHLIFIFDSCFSAALFKTRSKALTAKSLPSVILLEDLGRKARQFITSTDEKTKAPAKSIFTPELVKALDGNAAIPGLGIVTGKSLALWLRRVVSSSQETPTVPQFGDVDSEQGGDMVFLGGSHIIEQPAFKSFIRESKEKSFGHGSMFTSSSIVYYRKAADNLDIVNALDEENVPFTTTTNNRNPDSFKTNTLACHPKGPIEPVKAIAQILLKNGIDVMEIVQFGDHNKKKDRIELLNSARFSYGKADGLTLEQINALTSCPTMLANRIK